jgi:hypothetical protein
MFSNAVMKRKTCTFTPRRRLRFCSTHLQWIAPVVKNLEVMRA